MRHVIIHSSKLDESIKQTRRQISGEINNFTKIDNEEAKRIQYFVGEHLKDTILENTGIECCGCSEFFKEEHREGKENKVTLKCGHSVGKTCLNNKWFNGKCPFCRKRII